ncbi:MAG: cytochrome P450 [Myxococcales bacterium]|nr:cytochrome P450 [Myxococcales bacterium]
MVLRLLQWIVAQEWLMRLCGPLFGPFNPFLPEFRRDPHATFRRMREQRPFYYSRVFMAFIATRYEDVQFILRDKNFTTDRSQTKVMKGIAKSAKKDPEFWAMIDRNLLMLDGDEHRKLRGLVSKAFTPRRVEGLRPRIQAVVDDLMDQMAKSEDVELIRDLAHPLPIAVILEMLGLPSKDREKFAAWSRLLVQLLDPLQARGGDASIRTAVRELNAYLRPLLEERRAHPKDDLLSAMLEAEEDGNRMNERDLMALVSLILVAGHETTTHLIANAVVQLLRNPGERKRLQDNPALIETAVDEFLRFAGPILLTDRAAIEDCEVGGHRVRAGDLVVVVLAAANRDPAQFSHPEQLDLGRTENQHLGLGLGNHFCMGSLLAKLETEIAITTLLRRFPEFSGSGEPEEYLRSMMLWGPTALPIELGGGRCC